MDKTVKYSYIDSIRGYAVLTVVCAHTWFIFSKKDGTVPLNKMIGMFGTAGVIIFFIISALTLFLSVDSKLRKEKHPIVNFFLRRFFRIVPLFYFVLVASCCFNHFGAFTIMTNFLFINGFIPHELLHPILSVGWTLSIEMVFYLTIPFLFSIIKNLKAALIFYICTIIFSVITKYLAFKYLCSNLDNETLMGFTYYWLPAQLPIFAVGIILYFVIFKLKQPQSIKFENHLGKALIFGGVYFYAVFCYSNKYFITQNIAFSALFILFIWGMALNPNTWVNNKVSRFYGKISYSVYLTHMSLGVMFVQTFTGMKFTGLKGYLSGVGIELLITTTVSYILYLAIEIPFQKLGAKIITNLENRKVKPDSGLAIM